MNVSHSRREPAPVLARNLWRRSPGFGSGLGYDFSGARSASWPLSAGAEGGSASAGSSVLMVPREQVALPHGIDLRVLFSLIASPRTHPPDAGLEERGAYRAP